MCRQAISALCIIIVAAAPLAGGCAGVRFQTPQPTFSAGTDGSASEPPDYVIGPDDVLAIEFWREKDVSAEVIVRPDGRISLPLLNDVQAAGLTPDQLRAVILRESRRYLEDPNVAVIVRQINSRRAFITGEIEKPGMYPIKGPTTVMQLIAMAGGLREFAQSSRICVMRSESGPSTRCHTFNYQNVLKGKNLAQNIELRPGDTVIVP